MRPGQNKRMRGRNNNRRGPNPLTRSYESNGPDVKIRGNAQHVAEKYLQLARDAHTSGDPVGAENYLQHAEHYFRIIASAQAAQQQAQAGFGRPQVEGEAEDLDDDDDVGGLSDRFASPAERQPFQGQPNFGNGQPQPQPQGQPYPVYENDRPQQGDRPYQGGRPDRPNNRMDQRDNRGPRPDRPYQDRQDLRDNRGGRDNRPQRDFRPYREQNPMRETAQPNVGPISPTLPSFISSPARLAPTSEQDESSESAATERSDQPSMEVNDVESRLRGRRRRRPNFGFNNPGEGRGDESEGQPDPSEASAEEE